MSATLEEKYFFWLYSQVGTTKEKHRERTHWNLLRQLHHTEYVWFIPNDDNRLEDGRDLRHDFIRELQEQEPVWEVNLVWMDLGCSMLEFMIGLARRFAFQEDGDPRRCFWHLMSNIGLKHLTDREPYDPELVAETLDRVIWRTYEYNGQGGLFPLRSPKQDQRKVEVWYQLSAYLEERS